jgi:integrase
MSVRKRSWKTSKGETKEAWIIDYLDRDGDRHIETYDRKKDADARHDEVRQNVRKGVHAAPAKTATVAEAGEAWIKRVEANGMRGSGPVERGTLYQYRQHLKLHIAPQIGGIKLANLTKARVESFRDHLLGSMKSRAMARKVLVSFKSILKAENYSHVAANVSIGTNKREKRHIEAGRDFPTPAEVRRIIDAAKDIRIRALLLMAALTGLRASELRGLRWIDTDLKARELHVRQRADRFCKLGAPKSGMSRRTLPLPAELITVLREWKLACPKGEKDLAFPTAAGEIQQHRSMLDSLAPAIIDAGVVDRGKPKYALHAFRHFFASWCINPKERGGRGLSAKEVQALLGHETISVTMDIYGHLFPRSDDHAELDASTNKLLG